MSSRSLWKRDELREAIVCEAAHHVCPLLPTGGPGPAIWPCLPPEGWGPQTEQKKHRAGGRAAAPAAPGAGSGPAAHGLGWGQGKDRVGAGPGHRSTTGLIGRVHRAPRPDALQSRASQTLNDL